MLLPRDPYWLFTYWEVSTATKNWLESEINSDWDLLDLALRVYRFNRENTEEESHFDIKVPLSANNWYIKAGVPNKKYRVDLGCMLPEKGFKTIMASNIVTTPRDTLSEVIDESWRLPDWQERHFYWRIARNNLVPWNGKRGIHKTLFFFGKVG